MSGTKVTPSETPKCPQCGTPLPSGALAGLWLVRGDGGATAKDQWQPHRAAQPVPGASPGQDQRRRPHRAALRPAPQGFLFQSGDKQALTKILYRVLNLTSTQIADMGVAGREKVEHEYSSESHYRQLMRVYNDVLI